MIVHKEDKVVTPAFFKLITSKHLRHLGGEKPVVRGILVTIHSKVEMFSLYALLLRWRS
jgi:hypothetical protein